MNKIKEKITTILIQAFGEWGAFRESTKGKNYLPDGSHITRKYTNKVLKVLKANQHDILKKIEEMEGTILSASQVEDIKQLLK